MSSVSNCSVRAVGPTALLAVLLATTLLAPAQGAEPARPAEALRHQARIELTQPAPFVLLPLGPEVYARSRQAALGDLRLLDAQGQRVPFAFAGAPPEQPAPPDLWREAAAWRLPPRPAAGGNWASPVEVTVSGERIQVRQRGAAGAPAATSPGWLFDLGERAKDQPPPRRLQLQWSGPAEFSASYELEHSADLKQWRRAAGGQVLALAADAGALTQPEVGLPADCQRFVRLLWSGAQPWPAVTGARSATPQGPAGEARELTELVLAPVPEPAGPHAGPEAARALHVDLGGLLPVTSLELRGLAGTRVLPVLVQGRARSEERWQTLAGTVFYRVERAGEVQAPPPLQLGHRLRYLRLVPDERSGAMPAGLQLVLRAELARIVFPNQGQPPLALWVGSAEAKPGALPLATVVPNAQEERPRFGRARLVGWSEAGDVAAAEQRAEQTAALRPWLLWTLLLAGVAGLGLMVWRLARPSAKS